MASTATGRERGDWLDDQMTKALHQPYSAFHRFWFWAKKHIGRGRTQPGLR